MKFTTREKIKQKVSDVTYGEIFYDPYTNDYFMMVEQTKVDFDYSECIRISNGERVEFRDEQEVEIVKYTLEID